MQWKLWGYHVNKSDIGDMCLKKQWNFASSSVHWEEKKAEKQADDKFRVCMLNFLPNVSTLPSLVAITPVKVGM